MKEKQSAVIAIDGPSGSGKSTVSKALAQRLKILYIDTGAMYRALAYGAFQQKIPFSEGRDLLSFLDTIPFEYKYKNSQCVILVNGENVTQKIRNPKVSHLASVFSTLQSVRKYLTGLQKKLPKNNPCVMEGRDVGSVIFPKAFCKFFLTASLKIRAKRRLKQLQENREERHFSLEDIMKEVRVRDERDSTRELTPLRKEKDAELIDTSDLAFKDVVNILFSKAKKKAKNIGLTL